MENTLLPVACMISELDGAEDFVVLEVGTYNPGDIGRMANVICPDVTIVTKVGFDHIEDFGSKEAIAAEKVALVNALSGDGLAILNGDDVNVASMASETRARAVFFGRGAGHDYRVSAVRYAYPGPLEMDVACHGRVHRLRSRLVGEHAWLPVVAAFSAAVEIGIPPQAAAARIASFEPLFGRSSLMTTPYEQTLLLDTVQGSNESLSLLYRVVETAVAPYKRIVQGTISYYLGDPDRYYLEAYSAAKNVADEVVFVGPNAHRSGASQKDRDEGRFFEFQDLNAAHEHLKATAKKGELILVKGSVRNHLERIALRFEEEVKCEEVACGFKINCVQCGMYGYPFEQHRAIRKKLKAFR